MAINKNFVIKNGAEVNTKLLVADSVTQKVGIGTTVPTYSLHVFGPNEQPGSIGASVVNVTGVTTTNLLTVGAAATFSVGPVFIGVGQSTGTPLQPLQVGSATTVKGVYISGDTGIGATFPGAKLEVVPESTRIAGLFTGSTSDDMVRITQLGSGNALVVEDEANEDATSFVISGLGSVGIGTNVPRYLLDIDGTKLAGEGLAIGQTAVYIRGDVKIVGDLSADDLIFDQGVFNTLNVTGFSTFGGTSATLLNVSGITTVDGGFSATQGGDLARVRVTGITTLGSATATELVVTGITTLGDATATTAVVTGFSTLGGASATLLNVSGVTTVSGGFEANQGINATRLNVSGITTLGSATATELTVTGITTLGDATATTAVVTGFSTLGGASATLLSVSGVTTVSGGLEANQGLNAARLNVSGITTLGSVTAVESVVTGISTLGSVTATEAVVTGISTLGQVSATGVSNTGVTTSNSYTIDGTTIVNSSRELQNIASLDATTTATIEAAISNAPNELTDLFVTGISTLGQTTAEGLVVSGFSTLGATSASLLSVTGISTIANVLVTPGAHGVGATVGSSVGVVTYYGDGSQLQNIISGVGIQSGGNLVSYGATILNFVGAGNTFLYNAGTNTVDISIQGGGGGVGWTTYVAGIATASSVGVNTSTLDDPDLTGIGNSFQGLYIGNGMLIVDNVLNGNHYIGTNFNGLMAGPVTVNGTLTIDGNWVVV